MINSRETLFQLLSDPTSQIGLHYTFNLSNPQITIKVCGPGGDFSHEIREEDFDPICDLLESFGHPAQNRFREQIAVYRVLQDAAQQVVGTIRSDNAETDLQRFKVALAQALWKQHLDPDNIPQYTINFGDTGESF